MEITRNTDGTFQPGSGGRPKGSTNKATSLLREQVGRLLADNYETVAQDLKKLDPKSRADLWLRMLEFALPKLTRTEISEPPTDLEQLMRLTPEQRQQRIIELKQKIQSEDEK